METNLTPEYIQKIWNNKRVRQRLAFESPFWFSMLYLRHHFSYPLAPFHMEMFYLIGNPQYELIVVMAFRESGKSTVMNMANVLWSILGKPQKKFAIIFSKTQDQAKNHFTNIKHELENNELLKEDFGPFTENPNTWNKLSLELEYHNSKIMSVTREQSIRGMKHNQYRPDLIICDDMEDFSSTTNPTESDMVYSHFKSEIVSVGSNDTRIIVLGNLISENSLIMRLRKEIGGNNNRSVFRAYPLLDDNGKNLWKVRFSNNKAIEKLSDKSGEMWGREYLLNINISGEKHNHYEGFTAKEVKLIDDKWREIEKKYKRGMHNGRTPQKPLIEQMLKFRISAPVMEEDLWGQGKLSNEEHLAYRKELDEFHWLWNDAFNRVEDDKDRSRVIENSGKMFKGTPPVIPLNADSCAELFQFVFCIRQSSS